MYPSSLVCRSQVTPPIFTVCVVVFLFSKLADHFQSWLSAICPCTCESGMKRKLDSSAEENVPTFVANYALVKRLSPRLLLSPRNTCKHKRELRHFLEEITPQIHWLQDDFRGWTHKWYKSVKSTQEVRLQLMDFLFPFYFPICSCQLLNVRGHSHIQSSLVSWMQFLSFITKWHLMKLIMAQIMFWCLLTRKLKQW